MIQILLKLLFVLGALIIIGCGLVIYRDGKIWKHWTIPEIYLAGFKGFYFGKGNKVFGLLIIVTGLIFLIPLLLTP